MGVLWISDRKSQHRDAAGCSDMDVITIKSSLKSAFNYSVAQNKGWVLKSL